MATKSTTSKTTAAKKAATSKPQKTAPETPADISISVEPPKPISVDLGDQRYTVRPVKGSLGIALGSRLQAVQGDAQKLKDTIEHIVGIIFGPSASVEIIERLEDSSDALDYSHVMELMNALIEKSSGNPTT